MAKSKRVGVSKTSLANLKPQTKGAPSLNPGGKRKDGENPFRCDADFRRFMREDVASIKDPKQRKERLRWGMERLFSSAMAGDNRAMEMLLERAFGMPERKIDIASSGGNITFNVITGVAEPANGHLPDVIDVTPRIQAASQETQNKEFIP